MSIGLRVRSLLSLLHSETTNDSESRVGLCSNFSISEIDPLFVNNNSLYLLKRSICGVVGPNGLHDNENRASYEFCVLRAITHQNVTARKYPVFSR